MDRRAFFSKGVSKVAQTVTQHAADKARKNASRWIRPPFAIEELDLLIACTRCGECINACPYGIIFPLSSKLGVKVFNTPAMDLNNHGCHLCDSWPCVNACEKQVLKIPDSVESLHSDELGQSVPVLPAIAQVTINTKTCLPYSGPECGACRVCPIEGAMIWEMEKPSINAKLCIGCALCREACILEPKAINVASLNDSTA